VIKRLVAPLDPRHVRVVSFAASTGMVLITWKLTDEDWRNRKFALPGR
jgi:hypothetical protein